MGDWLREEDEGCDGKGVGMWVPRNSLLGETSTHMIFFPLVAGKQRRFASKTPFCYYKPDQSQTHPHQIHPLLFLLIPPLLCTRSCLSVSSKNILAGLERGDFFIIIIYIYQVLNYC